MRKIKYITSIIFIAIILFFIGDMYVWNIDSFETEYISTTMFLPKGISQEQMIDDIEKTAKEHNCLVFAVNRNIETIHSETVSIYCMNGVEDIVNKKSSINKGEYQSIFLGKIKVNIEAFEKIPDVNEIQTYYLIGDIEDARAFKSEMVDTYDGNFPKEGYTYFHSVRNVICVWSIGIVFLLLMTLYETILIKKEMAVRYIYGESLKNIVIKRIISDIILFVGCSVGTTLVLKNIFNVNAEYLIEVSTLCVGIYCIVNSILYLRLIFFDYKSFLNRGKGNRTVLNISYIYKIITIIIIALVTSVCTEMIFEGVNFWRQKEHFKEYSKYSYLSITSKDGKAETTEKMMLELINEKTKENKTFLNVYMDEGIYSKEPCLMFNKNTIGYLKGRIKEISNFKFENKVYFIVSEKQKDTCVKDLEMLAEMYIGENIDYEIITYENSCSVIGIKSQNGIISQLYNNPLIILNAGTEVNYYNGIYFSQACMVDINESEWNDYIENNDVEKNTSFITNVYDNYNYYLKGYQRTILLGAVAFVILMIMEFIIIKTMLRYESMINSIELAVKTVVGYSVFMKYRKMFITTFVSLGISAIGSMIVAMVLNMPSSIYMIIGYSVIGVMDVIMMLYYIRVIEKENIQKALKGSVL